MVIVAALVLLIPVSASSDLIKQMEFEIKIKEIIEEVYEASLKAALVAVKKTSLYARYRKARDNADGANDKYGEAVKIYEQASSAEFACEMSARSALRDTSVESPKAFLSTPFAESYNTYISHVCTVTREEVSLGELRAQTRKAKAKKDRALDDYVRLSTVSAHVLSEVVQLTDKFKWKLYWEGIGKKLKEQGVEITVDISRRLRNQQYKFREQRYRDTICVYLPGEDCAGGESRR